MGAMSKWERVQAALRGEPVDRVPVSFWGHDYGREWSAEGLAEAMLERHQRYDWDFMKVNPRACSFVEDWGCRYAPSGSAHEEPRLVESAVKDPADLNKLELLDIQRGAPGEQLHALELIGRGLKGDAPFIQTVFSPLTIADRLAGGDQKRIIAWAREVPEIIHQALSVIAETYVHYVEACLERGASGIFFAISRLACQGVLSEDEYRDFGRRYDLQVLGAAQGARFNVLHICGQQIMFDALEDYPVHALNWASAFSSNPDLREGLRRTAKSVMGGIEEKSLMVKGTPEEIEAQARRALEETGGVRFFLAPGCTIPPETPDASLRAVRSAVERFARR